MIEKRYKDIDADWFTPDQEAVIEQLSRFFVDSGAALAKIQAGHTVQTSHALYRQVRPKQEAPDGR